MQRSFGAFSGSLLLLSLLVAGCGGDTESSGADQGVDDGADPVADVSSSASAIPATPTTAPLPSAAEAEATIQAYVDAMRLGDTEAICDLETEAFKIFKYDDPAACADNLANQQPQAIFAEEVPIIDSATDGSPAYFTVLPYTGGNDYEAAMTLNAVDGKWLVAEFR